MGCILRFWQHAELRCLSRIKNGTTNKRANLRSAGQCCADKVSQNYLKSFMFGKNSAIILKFHF